MHLLRPEQDGLDKGNKIHTISLIYKKYHSSNKNIDALNINLVHQWFQKFKHHSLTNWLLFFTWSLCRMYRKRNSPNHHDSRVDYFNFQTQQGNKITNNIRLVLDILDYSELFDDNGFILISKLL